MDIVIESLHNAAVYLDGVSFVGRAAEIEVPHVKKKMGDHNGLGMFADIELPMGVEKLESNIKWSSFDAQVLQAIQDLQVHRLQVLGNLEVFTSQGLTAQLPVKYLVSGIIKDGGKAGFKKQQMVETSSVMAVYHSELYVAGVNIHLFDAFAQIWSVGGVDQLAQFRANLGG